LSRPRAGQHGQGIPIGEAAGRLGLNVDAVRKRIRRGTLPAYKRDDRWYVVLDGVQDDVLPGVQAAPSSPAGSPVQPGVQDSPPIEAAYQVTPALVEQAIERTGARYVADFAALYDRISAEVGRLYEGQLEAKDQTLIAQGAALAAKDETIATQQEVIVELRHRVGLAEAATVENGEALAEVQHRADLVEQEAAALRARLSPPVVALDERDSDRGTLEASTLSGDAMGGLWVRLGRWWRGEG
jgi:hypothetical protein